MKGTIANKIDMLTRCLLWVKNWYALPVFSWIKADLSFEDRRFQEAADLYLRGCSGNRTHPAFTVISLKLAYCQCKLGQHKEAIQTFRRSLELNNQSRETYIRLARLELWLCRAEHAYKTLKQAISMLGPDVEMSALFLIAALDSDNSAQNISEAYVIARRFVGIGKETPLLSLAVARYDFSNGLKNKAKSAISAICEKKNAPLEAFITMGEILLGEGNVGSAKLYLREALAINPQHPRTQTLLAESYLTESPGRSPEYALQLASNACQSSFWEHMHSMQVLAEAYYQCGKKTDAVLVANKARSVGLEKLRREKLSAQP